MSNVANVPLDYELQDICWKALRYDWGRHTATTGDAARTIIKLVPHFHPPRLQAMAVDIRNMLDDNDGKPNGLEIYEHDVAPFVELEKNNRRIFNKGRVL